jgi:hypothetical protein
MLNKYFLKELIRYTQDISIYSTVYKYLLRIYVLNFVLGMEDATVKKLKALLS